MIDEGVLPPGMEEKGPADAVWKMNDDHKLGLTGRGWKQSSIGYLGPMDYPELRRSEYLSRLSETEKYGQEAFHNIRKIRDKNKKSSLIASTSSDRKSRLLMAEGMRKLKSSDWHKGMNPDEYHDAMMACIQNYENFGKRRSQLKSMKSWRRRLDEKSLRSMSFTSSLSKPSWMESKPSSLSDRDLGYLAGSILEPEDANELKRRGQLSFERDNLDQHTGD